MGPLDWPQRRPQLLNSQDPVPHIPRPAGWIKLTAVVIPAHNAVIEQLLDNIERFITGSVAHPHRWGLRVVILRRLLGLSTTMAT